MPNSSKKESRIAEGIDPSPTFLDRIRNSLAEAAAEDDGWRSVFEVLLDQLVDDPALSSKHKLDELAGVQVLVSGAIKAITPAIPVTAPRLWMDRPARQKDPTQFVVDTYGNLLGLGLTQADIRRLDPQLYGALQSWKRRKGWPAEFELPSRRELNDEQVAALTDDDVRENRRIAEAKRNRSRKRG